MILVEFSLEIAMEARALFAVHLQIVADVAKLLILVLIAHIILLGWSKIANNLGWERFSLAILTYSYYQVKPKHGKQ